MSRPKIGVLVHFTSVFAHFRVFIVVADIQYGGDLESSENFLHVGYHFFRFLLQRFEKKLKNTVSRPKIGILVLFTSVFAHFRVFLVVADTHYGGDLES